MGFRADYWHNSFDHYGHLKIIMNIAQLSLAGFIAAIIRNIIQPVIVLIFALAIMYFLWNVAQFIQNIDNKDEIEKFKKNAVWGIVAIFVMASMWGLVQILINSFVPGAGVPSFDSGSRSSTKDRGAFSSPANPNSISGSVAPSGPSFDMNGNPTNVKSPSLFGN